MNDLAGLLSNSGSVDRLVVDRTEMSGLFDFNLKFVPSVNEPDMALGDATSKYAPPVLPTPQIVTDTMPEPAGPPPTLFTALREQLGLKLEPTNGPAETLTIDHIEEPTPN